MKVVVSPQALHLEDCNNTSCSCEHFIDQYLRKCTNGGLNVNSFWNTLLFLLDVDPFRNFYLKSDTEIFSKNDVYELCVYFSPKSNDLFLLRQKLKISTNNFLNKYINDITLIYTMSNSTKNVNVVLKLLEKVFKKGRKVGINTFHIGQEMKLEQVTSLLDKVLRSSESAIVATCNDLHTNKCNFKQTCPCVVKLLDKYNSETHRRTDATALWQTLYYALTSSPTSTDTFDLNVYFSQKANCLFLLRRKPENMKKSEAILKRNFSEFDDVTLIFSKEDFSESTESVITKLKNELEVRRKGKQIILERKVRLIEITSLLDRLIQ